MTSTHRSPTECRRGAAADAVPTPWSEAFGSTLRRLRLAAGLTQEALARRAGISARAVSDLERDPARTPRLVTVGLLADALRVTPDQRADLLRAARPAPAAGGHRTVQRIPRPLTTMVGRDAVSAELVSLIRTCSARLITLSGAGGVGKTRLALDVAARVEGDVPDGAVFVDLSGLRDPVLVIPAVARLFGLDERDELPVHDRLASVLRTRRTLIVLDNFEHVLPARAELLALLTACPLLVALVTSRVALRLRGEHHYRVEPLELTTPQGAARSPAVALLEDRARAIGVELTAADEPAAEAICRRLDGLPLAIELAAARLGLLAPEDLARALEQRLPLLTMGPDDLPDRQRTMRNAIAWSYDLLSWRQQALFRTLSVFAGGWDLAAAECVSTDPAVPDVLAALADANLVVTDRTGPQVRFAMLATIREFGREQAAEAGETDSARRHAEYFTARAESRPDALSTDIDNLRAALAWAVDARRADLAYRLCAALWPRWCERGDLVEGIGWARRALALRSADLPTATRIATLTGAATMAIDLSAFDDAAVWCERLVDLARQDRPASEVALALNTRGRLARLTDRYADAIADHEEALALADGAGDEHGRATALVGLSYARFFTGDAPGARELAELGLASARAADNRREFIDALLSAVRVAMHTGDLERADTLAAEVVDSSHGSRDVRFAAEALRALGTSAAFQGEYERAVALLEQSLALYQDSGDERLAPQLLSHLAFVALNTGDHAHAEDMCTHSLRVARHFDDQWAVAMSTTLLGHIELATGRIEQARRHFYEGAAVLSGIHNPLFLTWCLEGMAGVAVAVGDDAGAARLCAVRDEVLARLSAVLPPAHVDGYRQTVDAITASGGPDALAAAADTVHGLTLDELLAAVGGA